MTKRTKERPEEETRPILPFDTSRKHGGPHFWSEKRIQAEYKKKGLNPGGFRSFEDWGFSQRQLDDAFMVLTALLEDCRRREWELKEELKQCDLQLAELENNSALLKAGAGLVCPICHLPLGVGLLCANGCQEKELP